MELVVNIDRTQYARIYIRIIILYIILKKMIKFKLNMKTRKRRTFPWRAVLVSLQAHLLPHEVPVLEYWHLDVVQHTVL
jgi:hypothetical protein